MGQLDDVILRKLYDDVVEKIPVSNDWGKHHVTHMRSSTNHGLLTTHLRMRGPDLQTWVKTHREKLVQHNLLEVYENEAAFALLTFDKADGKGKGKAKSESHREDFNRSAHSADELQTADALKRLLKRRKNDFLPTAVLVRCQYPKLSPDATSAEGFDEA